MRDLMFQLYRKPSFSIAERILNDGIFDGFWMPKIMSGVFEDIYSAWESTKKNTYVIKSPRKSGKTKSIINFIKKNPHCKILVILQNIKSFESFNNRLEEEKLDRQNTDVYHFQNNSCDWIMGRHYDFVIIDDYNKDNDLKKINTLSNNIILFESFDEDNNKEKQDNSVINSLKRLERFGDTKSKTVLKLINSTVEVAKKLEKLIEESIKDESELYGWVVNFTDSYYVEIEKNNFKLCIKNKKYNPLAKDKEGGIRISEIDNNKDLQHRHIMNIITDFSENISDGLIEKINNKIDETKENIISKRKIKIEEEKEEQDKINTLLEKMEDLNNKL